MTENNALPPGWMLSTIGDICETTSGGTPSRKVPSYYGGDIPWLKSGELNDSLIYEIEELITEEGLQNSSAKIFPQGTLLIALYGATVGRLGILGVDAATNQAVCALFPPEELDKKFLFWFLRKQRDELLKARIGGAQPNISQTILRAINIPIPPPSEQERIVAKIEELFTQLEAGVAELRQTRALLQRYRQAVLKSAVAGELTREWREARRGDRPGRPHISAEELLARILSERRAKWEAEGGKGKYKEPAPPDTEGLPELPEGWVWVNVEQLASVQTGATPLRSNPKYWTDGTIPWVTSGALNELFVDEESELITELAIKETNTKLFPKHTLLVAMYGEGKTRGKVSELLLEASTNQAIAALIFDGAASSVRPFVKLFFRDYYYEIRRLASGGVQPNLNLGIIKGTALPLPPLKEQQRIIDRVARRLSVADEIEKELDQALARAGRLRQSILKRAFEGRLV